MVRAILEGRKTQTRRVVKPQPPANFMQGDVAAITNGERWAFSNTGWSGGERGAWPPDPEPGILCPYGQPGDQLWVRETWMPDPSCDDDAWDDNHITYTQWTEDFNMRLADMPASLCRAGNAIYRASWDGQEMAGWKPSIHMPRWASRIQLEIVSVRVERLNDISDHDALAEGCSTKDMQHGDRLASVFSRLWESINGAGSWEANPYVWVVEFKRV